VLLILIVVDEVGGHCESCFLLRVWTR
jgi:hypothetical protein